MVSLVSCCVGCDCLRPSDVWQVDVLERIKMCCDELDKLVKSGDVLGYGDKICVYGKPKFVNDGGGHYDDMTDWHEIAYCPFCGVKLDERIP